VTNHKLVKKLKDRQDAIIAAEREKVRKSKINRAIAEGKIKGGER
jgi:hypothetical protein